MLQQLQAMPLNDLRALLLLANSSDGSTQIDATEVTSNRLPPAVSRRSPLALPTISLVMALSSNPIVIAANLPLMLWNAFPIGVRAWRMWQRERRLNIDFLDTLAIGASVAQNNRWPVRSSPG
jgi:Cu2+-exporting ATPase